MSRKYFRDAVMDKFGCSAEEYADRVFYECVPRLAKPAVRVLHQLQPKLFCEDFELIHAVATAQDIWELERNCDIHHWSAPPKGVLRETLKMRLSGRRLLRLGARVWRSS